ncbi:pyridoxamine 5'-phosphate oxidase [Desulfuromonas soudanensis]|uniref:Pyridoxamine 5'-phosphate oxidase n=1 Tax=Desulfuromonas soudanensis TaxID=1603606 RepID=A0A0M4D378_9BACT|nr:pyridoxamine 5'-phosphate oxidase family protein [Desulfuromonas soudanensis]ALC17865.1 pyridoxamine 5'-phosphate oxidase [Desulfuromonas soudanensis]
MIPERIRQFLEENGCAFVASADGSGQPHLAAGHGLRFSDDEHLLFEAWFCRKTLANVAANPRVALLCVDPACGTGYQLVGEVVAAADTAILNGYVPPLEPRGLPQVQSRLEIRISEVMEFSTIAHSDRSLIPHL